MSHVLVGVFEEATGAQQARDDLRRSGFADETMRLLASGSVRLDDGAPQAEHSIAETIGDMFRSLFGASEHADLYHEAIDRGSLVLMVQADTEQSCGTALDILHRRHAADIHVRNPQRAPGRRADDDRLEHAQPLDERVVSDIPVLGEAPEDGAALPPPGVRTVRAHTAGQKLERQ
ncbi:hypothetical protein OOT46_27600 [Aquabacterium sp. A7-Y]|uniref:hypothetical protein n=1 Tax=Aquabacterium sp. A7-Y TaxID=1349605 RepID=UPI00223D7AC7|nr:hypothetical protein [Aquabacterium sp. A7-Y]MCW7541575.1 hypothetical protein [Aquabacterium sp. A7-Y]